MSLILYRVIRIHVCPGDLADISESLGGTKDGIRHLFRKNRREKQAPSTLPDRPSRTNPPSVEFRAGHLTQNMPILEIDLRSWYSHAKSTARRYEGNRRFAE